MLCVQVFTLKYGNEIEILLPNKAPKATKLPIQDNSSVDGTKLSGESDRSFLFVSFGNAGDVHPKVVPNAILLIFAVERTNV